MKSVSFLGNGKRGGYGVSCFAFLLLASFFFCLPLPDVFGAPANTKNLLPQPVLNIQIECIETGPEAIISWAPVTGAKMYALYRKSPNTSWYETLANLTKTSYTDTFFPSGVGGYQYQLRATSPSGSMNHSEIESVIIPLCTDPSLLSSAVPSAIITPTTSDPLSTTAAPTPSAATNTPIPFELIANSSLEATGADGDPENWYRGGWGTNSRTYTYPTAGIDGGKAAQVQITSYISGDAKWYFGDVPVVPNNIYTLSHVYKANVATQLMARFQTPSGILYQFLGTEPPATAWTTSTINIIIPVNATAMTFFHILTSIGTLEVDGYNLRMNATTDSTSATAPDSTAIPAGKKYVILNAITWGTNPLQNLPLEDISEASYFVLPVDASGNLLQSNSLLEKTFIANVKAKGKKATFSVAGGAQNVSHIISAVTINTTAFINNIAAHLTQFGYDGVVLDIENTNMPSGTLPIFINQLRTKLGPAPSIGVYVQPWEKDTVHARLNEAADSITWISPMIYDFIYTIDELKALTLAWLPKVNGNKSKLLAGVAVNYATGLTAAQYSDILKWINEQGLGGIGVWQNTLFAQPWIDAQRAVWLTVQ